MVHSKHLQMCQGLELEKSELESFVIYKLPALLWSLNFSGHWSLDLLNRELSLLSGRFNERSDAKRSVVWHVAIKHQSVSTYIEHPPCARLYLRHVPAGDSTTEKRTKIPSFSAPFISHPQELTNPPPKPRFQCSLKQGLYLQVSSSLWPRGLSTNTPWLLVLTRLFTWEQESRGLERPSLGADSHRTQEIGIAVPFGS